MKSDAAIVQDDVNKQVIPYIGIQLEDIIVTGDKSFAVNQIADTVVGHIKSIAELL